MDERELNERALKVINEERCKHGMIFEYCATCQEYKVPREYKFPIDYINDDGELKTAWLGGVTQDTYYYKYRRQNPDIKQDRKGINKRRYRSANDILNSYSKGKPDRYVK